MAHPNRRAPAPRACPGMAPAPPPAAPGGRRPRLTPSPGRLRPPGPRAPRGWGHADAPRRGPSQAQGRAAREDDAPDADAVLLSGTGLPTIGVIEVLERDLGKPVVSSNQASLRRALRLAGVRESISGFGRLLSGM